METQEIRHINVGSKYRVQFEQAASAKGTLGFKVEVNGDDMDACFEDAVKLLANAKLQAPQPQG